MFYLDKECYLSPVLGKNFENVMYMHKNGDGGGETRNDVIWTIHFPKKRGGTK